MVQHPEPAAMAEEALSIEFRRPGEMPGHHWHRQVEVNIPLDGPVHYLIGERRITLPAGHVGLFWGLIPHRLVDQGSCERMAILNIPLPLFLGFALDEALQSRLLQGQVIVSDRAHLFGEGDIRRWQQDAGHRQPHFAALLQEEIALMCRRVALTGWHSLQPEQGAVPLPTLSPERANKLHQMIAFMSCHYREGLKVAQVAQAARLHPNYAMQLFRQVMGASIKQYLLTLQINHARVLLAESRRPVQDIALSCGFSGQSRFYDAFGRLTGLTPRQYRRQSRAEEQKTGIGD
jgi:AraC-like DNA-binding protein